VSKTGGGVGTNQYQVRGQAKRRPKTVHGCLVGRVIKRGQCVWLRAGFDDVWCLKHRQLSPELRQLSGLQPCITQLDEGTRQIAAKRMPPAQLAWAATDEDWRVRLAAVWRMPQDRLQWATTDEDWEVRKIAAKRMPQDQLSWAATDKSADVRYVAAQRMPQDRLSWAVTDPCLEVRTVAHSRVGPQLRRMGPQ
jgi:hypothetical protein